MPTTEQTTFTHSEVVAMMQRERTRTLAILGTFLGVDAGEPGSGKVTLRDQELVRLVLWRVDSRDVIKVMHDDEPVIQHQPDDEPLRDRLKYSKPVGEPRVCTNHSTRRMAA